MKENVVAQKEKLSRLILEDREKRFYEVMYLAEKYSVPVVCGKLNYPGQDKNTSEANKAFEMMLEIIKDRFDKRIIFARELNGYDGRSILAAVDMSPQDAKRLAVDIEDNNTLGRVFDVDIYLKHGESVGRESIDIEPRKCIICGNNARLCIKSGSHSLAETLSKINEIINNCGE